MYRDLADRDKAFEESLTELERILNEEGDEITALVMEPLVQAAAGMLVMPHGYLKRVRELTEAHDVFLIVDEVATGFGRTGKFFACEHEGVSPDFMTLSKGITGGYMPLAATLTTKRVFDAFLGTFEERRYLAIAELATANDDKFQKAFLTILETFKKETEPLFVKISPQVVFDKQVYYLKQAKDADCQATIVSEDHNSSPFGLVIHSDAPVQTSEKDLRKAFSDLWQEKR